MVCDHSSDPPAYFACDELTGPTESPSESPAPTAPTVSPGPTVLETVVLVRLRTDSFPTETGWRIENDAGQIVHEVLPEFYSDSDTVYLSSVELNEGRNFRFIITDKYGDGFSGEIILFAGSVQSVDTVLAYYDGFSGSLVFSVYPINFTASIDATIDIVPTTAPTTTTAPTSPTASPAPSSLVPVFAPVFAPPPFAPPPFAPSPFAPACSLCGEGWRVTSPNVTVVWAGFIFPCGLLEDFLSGSSGGEAPAYFCDLVTSPQFFNACGCAPVANSPVFAPTFASVFAPAVDPALAPKEVSAFPTSSSSPSAKLSNGPTISSSPSAEPSASPAPSETKSPTAVPTDDPGSGASNIVTMSASIMALVVAAACLVRETMAPGVVFGRIFKGFPSLQDKYS